MNAPAPERSEPDRRGPGVLHVIAESPDALQDGLDAAVLQLRETATNDRPQGILITRRSRSLFTVETSTEVPYGTTIEKDRWHRQVVPRATGMGDEAGQ